MTPEQPQLVVVSANTVTLVVSEIINFLFFRARRRIGSRSLRALTAGLGSITVGTLVGATDPSIESRLPTS